MLKQPQYQPMPLDKQVMSLWAVGNGQAGQACRVEHVKQWEADMHAYMDANHPEIGQSILRTKDLAPEMIDALSVALDDFNKTWTPPE